MADIYDDPRRIIANYIQGSHPASVHAAGEAMLRDYERRTAADAARANLMENIRSREGIAREGAANRAQSAKLDYLGRRERTQNLATAHQDTLRQQAIDERDKQFSRLMTAASFLPPGDPRAKQIQDYALQLAGVPAAAPAAPSAADAAIARTAAAGGMKPAATTTQGAAAASGGAAPPAGQAGVPPTGAPPTQQAPTFSPGEGLTEPTPPPKMIGYRWMAGTGGVSGGNDARMEKYYDDGSMEVVPASSIPGVERPTLAPVRRNVEGGLINPEFAKETGIPPGYDFNFNTGRMVPQSDVGTINGVPSPQAVAQKGMQLGINPVYSPAAMDVVDRARTQASDYASAGGGKPILDVGPKGFDIGGTSGTMVPKPAGVGELVPPEGAPQTAAAAATTPAQPAGAPAPIGSEHAYDVFKTNPLDIMKSVGQGLFPRAFGYPEGTPGTEGGVVKPFAPSNLANQPAQSPQGQGGATGPITPEIAQAMSNQQTQIQNLMRKPQPQPQPQ